MSYTNGYNYLNNGHCSMWVMEGGAVEKTDNTGAVFRLYAGDVIIIRARSIVMIIMGECGDS